MKYNYCTILQPKCEQYWPSGVEESISLSGGMSVQLLEVVPFADYEMRKLVISHVSGVPAIDIHTCMYNVVSVGE